MRFCLTIILFLLAQTAFAFQPSPDGPLKSRAVAFDKPVSVPSGVLTDGAGKGKRLTGYKGQVSVVTFWTTLCHICREEMPMLAKLAKKLEGTQIKVRPISVDDPKARTAYIKRHMEVTGIDNLPLLRDLDFAVWNRVGARGTPTTIIIDRYNQVVAAFVGGHIDWLNPEITDYLEALASAPNAKASRALLAGS